MMLVSCSKNDNITGPKEENANNTEAIKLTKEDKQILKRDQSLSKSSKNSNPCRIANQIRLKYIAKTLAVSMKNDRIRNILKEKISQEFDGDKDVLWEMVKNYDISNGQNMKKVLGDKIHKDASSILNMSNLEQVPLLNIAIPANFEDWDGDKPIKVAYVPITKDDMETEKVIAYDSQLNRYKLDAQEAPDEPVVIVGINERVEKLDNKGRLQKVSEKAASSEDIIKVNDNLYHLKYIKDSRNSSPLNKSSGGTISREYGDTEFIEKIKVKDDQEYWFMGKAEVRFQASKFRLKEKEGEIVETQLRDRDRWGYPKEFHCGQISEGTYGGWNKRLFTWNRKYVGGDWFVNYYNKDVKYFIYIYEEDPSVDGPVVLPVPYLPITIKYEIGEMDDKMGKQTVRFSDHERMYTCSHVNFLVKLK